MCAPIWSFSRKLLAVLCNAGLTPSLLRSGALHLAAVQQNISYQKELIPRYVASTQRMLDCATTYCAFARVGQYRTADVCSVCDFTVVCLDPQTPQITPFPPEVAARTSEMYWPSTPRTTPEETRNPNRDRVEPEFVAS